MLCFAIFIIKPQIYVKLCLKPVIAYFYEKCGKTVAILSRHDLWEQIEHITAHLGKK